MVTLPGMIRVKQHFAAERETDVEGAVHRELKTLGLEQSIKSGDTVALTAGSRGVANIPLILRETVAYLRSLGAEPFLAPTMGSHGGGTAQGQRQVIEGYGITEDFVGAPIRSSMEVVQVGVNDFDVPVYLDKHCSQADHIGVVGRVKPHTGFSGKVESGLCKMIMIGLGKHVGAQAYHTALVTRPWEPFVRSVTRVMLDNAPIRFGLAVVENGYDETAKIKAVLPEHFESEEERLLELAREWMPKLPFAEADLLIIDEIGKEISGAGLDTNVVGRKAGLNGESGVHVHRIFVRDLSSKTQGNATGIGLADFTTKRLVDSMDYKATTINCLTASHPLAANIPVYFENDRDALEAAVQTVGLTDLSRVRIQWIKNTLQLAEVLVSDNYDLQNSVNRLEELGASSFAFDDAGNLVH